MTEREGVQRRTDGEPGTSVDALSFELSARRTGMSFQRTRMSAERTLMSVIRTALALIGFGFTIFQFFEHLQATHGMVSTRAPAHFGEILVAIGILMLAGGISYHVSFMAGLREERGQMVAQSLIHGESKYPVSLTLLVAVALLLLGTLSIASMLLRRGPL